MATLIGELEILAVLILECKVSCDLPDRRWDLRPGIRIGLA